MWHKAEGVGKESKIKQKKKTAIVLLVGDLKSSLDKRFSVCDKEVEKQETVWSK